MAVEVVSLKPTSNELTLDRIHKYGSTDYQRRIPLATKAGVQATMKALQDNRPLFNEFIDALVNRIGQVIVRNNSWSNPLKEFKVGMLEYGDTIEEVQTGLIKARSYDNDRDSLERDIFGTALVDVQSNFHKVNRQDKYKITVNTPLLQRAFLQENGLSNFVEKLMEAPTTSDQWDEFLLMCELFPTYYSNGGFFKIQVPDIVASTSTEEDAKRALRVLRATADNLTFISTRYNAAGMPVAAQRDDLLIFCTPEFKAAIDVEALAGAFNVESAQMHGRIIPIPAEKFGIDGLQAIMTTKQFFVVADQLFENTSLWNPDSLQNNHWLHHWQIISASRFVPAILFTTKPGDEIIEVSNLVESLSAITVTATDGTNPTDLTRGQIYQFSADTVTQLEDGSNEGVRWSVSGNTSAHTYITQEGVLHVAGVEGGNALTITATATYLDPANLMKDGISESTTMNVVGESQLVWPVAGSQAQTVTGITVKGVAVPNFNPATKTYTVAVAGGTAAPSDVVVSGPDAGDVSITTNSAGTTVTVSAPSAPGDPVYTITITAA